MDLAFAATADRPTAVLTGPSVIAASRPRLIRMPLSAVVHEMVRVGLEHHPLAATAALVWSGDLPRTLQQILFDTAESITSPGRARQVEPELKAMCLSVTHPGQAAALRSLVPSRGWLISCGCRSPLCSRRGGRVLGLLGPRHPITDGYATTGSADYAAAARRGELNDVNCGGLSGGRCRGGRLMRGAPERRQRADESWTTWLITRGYWRSAAACRFADPDLFFPISDSGPAREQMAEAKAICATCRVRRECLAFALRTGQVHGIWGGTTEDERAAARRRTASEQPVTDERRPA